MGPFHLSTLRLLAILSISTLPFTVKANGEIDVYLTQAQWPSEIIGWIPEDYNGEDPSYGLHVKAEPGYVRYQLKIGDIIDYKSDKRNQRWMRRIPDATPISALSLPGTHASAFFGKTIDKSQRVRYIYSFLYAEDAARLWPDLYSSFTAADLALILLLVLVTKLQYKAANRSWNKIPRIPTIH